VPERVAHYRITRKLGEGGMGVVYAAHDERLDRTVAIKMVRSGTGDGTARDRLWREARSAAAVNHPNVCQLYEVGEEQGELFIAMELLEGESVASRLARGPMALAEATKVCLAILAALEPLHARGLVHRDLKPSNVFLTPHGVKLLDFGLARPIVSDLDATNDLTVPGMVMGTPHYLSPEQLLGQPVDARSDLFAAGALLYEMLSGRRAFSGGSAVEVFHAVLHQEPPALGGSPLIAGIDRIVRRALSKKPERRYADAEAMASELRAAVLLADTSGETIRAQLMRRLIVIPFRILRSDPDTDFLAFSLPDAITGSLSRLDSIVVRSSVSAARFKPEDLDLARLAEQADVDIVLTGTLLRAGDQVRVATQLVETRSGALIWSQTSQVPLGDVFQLQDRLTRRIVESLAVPLSTRDQQALQRDVPANPKAYELYLRANQLAFRSSDWVVARDLYLECVELDPDFAPAWARLGRIHRLIAQYSGEPGEENYEKARQCFERALALDPDLAFAHHFYTHLEIDLGRSQQAMVRLLGRVAQHPTDAELYAGLVQSCRYSGLLEASVAAYEQAVRLDPDVRTSVNHSYLMLGDYERSVQTNLESPPMLNALALDLWGRRSEAIALLLELEQKQMPRMMRGFIESTRLILQERHVEARAMMSTMMQNFTVRDPCATFYFARSLAAAGDDAQALAVLGQSVEGGFSSFEFTTRDPWFAGLRGHEQFRSILRRAEARERQARAAFIEAGGDRILGV
jgi:serine/threonine protein kinase/cytochrome c-type biogenesis protein CcmH/NrfG